MYHKFRHDYYSKTYPRYEGYSDVENKADLVDMIKTIHDNETTYFQDHMFHNADGSLRKYFTNSVGSVLSTQMSSELSDAMIQQITIILSGPGAQVALSAPFVTMIENNTFVQSALVENTGSALSNNVLSSQMITAVGTVISTDTLSTEVVDITEKGIKLSSIMGGKEYPDQNNNGIDDNQEDFVIGNLGA